MEWTNEEIEEMHLRRQVWDYAAENGGLILDIGDFSIAFPIKRAPTLVDDLIPVRKAAIRIKCAPETIYAAIKRGEIPPRRSNDSMTTMLSTYDIDEWAKFRHRPPIYKRKNAES